MPEHSTEKEVEGVKVRETGHKQWEKDYTQSDMEAVSALAPPLHQLRALCHKQ